MSDISDPDALIQEILQILPEEVLQSIDEAALLGTPTDEHEMGEQSSTDDGTAFSSSIGSSTSALHDVTPDSVATSSASATTAVAQEPAQYDAKKRHAEIIDAVGLAITKKTCVKDNCSGSEQPPDSAFHSALLAASDEPSQKSLLLNTEQLAVGVGMDTNAAASNGCTLKNDKLKKTNEIKNKSRKKIMEKDRADEEENVRLHKSVPRLKDIYYWNLIMIKNYESFLMRDKDELKRVLEI